MTKNMVPRKMEGLGAYSPKNDFGKALSLNARTYSRHEWHGIAGTVNVSTHDSPTTSNTRGSILFMVPTVRSGFTYRDALDIYFENVGTFNGRLLNAQMHFDTIEYGPYTSNIHYNISYSSNPTGIFFVEKRVESGNVFWPI